MFRRRDPSSRRLRRHPHDLVHHFHAVRTRLSRAGEDLDGSMTVVSETQPQQTGIAVFAGRGGANNAIERYSDVGLGL